ncbi:MAG TPA: hypothetical protein VF361_08700 [Candidatus Limnocylindrales bacterium]
MRRFWNRHISESDLAALADGGTASARQKSHLAACTKCAERLSAHERIGRALATKWVSTTASISAARTAPRARYAVPVAALAVVLVGALLFRANGGPATPSQSPTADQTTTAPLTARPTVAQFALCHPGTPPATASPEAGGMQPITLPGSKALGGAPLTWSPDGKHFIYATDSWELYDDNGRGLAGTTPTPGWSSGFFAATWLDSDTYAIHSMDAGVVICRLDGSGLQLPGSHELANMIGPGMVGNGHGALAVALDRWNFVVWDRGSLSAPTAGLPVQWSPDGTRLLIATSGAQDPGSTADAVYWDSVAIVSYPGLQRTTTFDGVHVAAYVDKQLPLEELMGFSPDGLSIAFGTVRWDPTKNVGPGILDVATGKVTAVPAVLHAGWLPNSRLFGESTTTPAMQEWDGSKFVPSDLPPYTISVSPTSVVAYAAQVGAETVTRLSRNGIPIRDVPLNPFEIDWSPDGSHVVVFGFDQVGPFLVSVE